MFPMSADADLDKVMAVGVEKRSRGPQIITKNTDSILRNTERRETHSFEKEEILLNWFLRGLSREFKLIQEESNLVRTV